MLSAASTENSVLFPAAEKAKKKIKINLRSLLPTADSSNFLAGLVYNSGAPRAGAGRIRSQGCHR